MRMDVVGEQCKLHIFSYTAGELPENLQTGDDLRLEVGCLMMRADLKVT